MSPAAERLPAYLRQFVAEQEYDSYTARDHAAWRFIMRQNKAFFSQHAVSVYLEGLKKTGISSERIPRVSEMDECLSKLGWGAVPVEGFIPPAAFLDFQARGILPIACDMRTVSHLAYTPAPDIVHEAAGHAPILADQAYAKYLHRYASLAQKAIASEDDIRLYEAIRTLSDIKENPDAAPADIANAEAKLKAVTATLGRVSEAAKVARMNWWTVEYGLMGDVENPRIYGAGLLSSVGESQSCLSKHVRKVPLSIDCVDTAYDITEPQPQLFVARDMDQLLEVLESLEKTLAYKRGGMDGLREALFAKTVTTVQLDSGLEISGILADALEHKSEPCFVKCSGPVQLCYQSDQLANHGRERHASGFSSPIGRWKNAPSKPVYDLSDADLKTSGLEKGKTARLVFTSGFEVRGRVADWTRAEGKLVLVTWQDCHVTRGNETFFKPEWGEFDMAVGEGVPSVWGGPSDRVQYGDFNVGKASTSPGRSSPFTKEELSLFALYAQMRALREDSKSAPNQWQALAQKALQNHPDEWLLHVELGEAAARTPDAPWAKSIEKNLARLEANSEPSIVELIRKGRAVRPS